MKIMFRDYNNSSIEVFTEDFTGTRKELISYLDNLNIPASCEAIHVYDGEDIIMAKTREGIRDIENEEWLVEYQTLEEIEEERKMKVTMNTAGKLQKLRHASNTYPIIKVDGGEYVQIIDLDTPSYDGRYGESFWEGYAVRLGDDIDEEGYAPVYTLIWFLDNPDAEDGSDTVNDWEEVDKVIKIGEINLETGRII